MKKIFCVIIVAVVLALSGCSKAVTASDMPEIVFMIQTSYNPSVHGFYDDESSDHATGSLVFLDKNGDYYFTESLEIRVLKPDELIERLKSGDDRLEKTGASRNTDEILENYKKLLKAAANNNYELIYPERIPAVEDDRVTWYGLYYDKNGNLSSLPIHARECATSIEANDDRANEIYKWYSNGAN